MTDWRVTKLDPVDPMTQEEWRAAYRDLVKISQLILRDINARHPELLEYIKSGDYANADKIVMKTIFEEGLG